MKERSFFLSAASSRLAASCLFPDDRLVQGAILIAPPLVEERKGAILPMVEAARRFVDELHVVVLRIDYSGTGDSQGAFETARPLDWPREIADASDWLMHFVPGVPLCWFAIRTGCPLVLQALDLAKKRPDALLFWDAVSGRESLQQWLRRHMVNNMIAYGSAHVSRAELEKNLGEGGRTVDLDGFAFAAPVSAALQRAALPTLAQSSEWPPLLSLASGHPSSDLKKALEGRSRVTEKQLHLPPYWNSVGYIDTVQLREASLPWLKKCFQETAAVSLAIPPSAFSMDGSGNERMVAIPDHGRTIRGVLHNRSKKTAPDGRAVLFLGGWSGDRKGPHRLFVEFARDLALRGIPSLRIDYRGRGEGDGSAADGSIRKMVEDASSAITWLHESGKAPKGVVLVAICSGCKVAITASSEPAVNRLVLWSAETMGSLRSSSTNARKTFANLGVYFKKLFRAETWRKLARGEVNTNMVGKALVHHETRSASEAKDEDRTLRTFRSFRGPLTFIYGSSDPNAPAAQAAYKRFCKRYGLKADFSVIPNAGHSYYGLDWTEELLKRTRVALFRTCQ